MTEEQKKILWECKKCGYFGYPGKAISCPTCGSVLHVSKNILVPKAYQVVFNGGA